MGDDGTSLVQEPHVPLYKCPSTLTTEPDGETVALQLCLTAGGSVNPGSWACTTQPNEGNNRMHMTKSMPQGKLRRPFCWKKDRTLTTERW